VSKPVVGIVGDLGHVLPGNVLDEVDLAAKKGVDPRGVFRNRHLLDRVEVGQTRLPVVRVLDQDRAHLRLEGFQHERPGPVRLGDGVSA
jgi:hypothetical protein